MGFNQWVKVLYDVLKPSAPTSGSKLIKDTTKCHAGAGRLFLHHCSIVGTFSLGKVT